MICDEELSLFNLSDASTVAFLETLVNVSNAYGVVHKYVCLFICIFGSLANIVHIFVLTRPIMQRSAVNRLLAIIGVCDIFTMLSYLMFVIRFGFAVDLSNPPPGYALHWIIFLLAHVVCSIALHTITLYLTCATAYIRYKTLKKVGSKWNHKNAACPIFLCVASFVILLCVPTFLIHSIVKVTGPLPPIDGIADNRTLYTVGLAEFKTVDTCVIFKSNLWLTGIFFKVIPCILLMLFTVALLYELELNRRRRQLITSGSTPASRKNIAQSDRTTKVLIILSQYRETLRIIVRYLYSCVNPNYKYAYATKGKFMGEVSSCGATGYGLTRNGRSSSRSRLLSPLCITNGNTTIDNTFNYSSIGTANNSSYNIHKTSWNSSNGPSPSPNLLTPNNSQVTPTPAAGSPMNGPSVSPSFLSPLNWSSQASPTKCNFSQLSNCTSPARSPTAELQLGGMCGNGTVSNGTVCHGNLVVETSETSSTTMSLRFLDESDVLL
ncbi:serpentine type 7TM GPCR chemoreceptor srw domain-containing protein [Ditylenchus destructor]|uniref:Serpentine type 7TM GPCR chemoreceptor srw domain-containing protein n=1 Tax=Ditylenchus destructor TaxID=166010 RepID=A0AAD4QU27_9BILA|nr:serpentine type 7TM GPCR chemoreceptor srw domain-containing protein [Ditylenchus destructor]